MIVDILRLMSVLILKNVKTEGPGTIEDFLQKYQRLTLSL